MLDFAPSSNIPKYAFGMYDRVTITGTEYRAVDATDEGYVFVRLDSQGFAEAFSRGEISRLVSLGHVEHERDALLPENARARLAAPAAFLSKLSDAQHRRAGLKEAAVLAFLELEAEGQVKRTDTAIKDAIDAIVGRAGRIHKGASQYDEKQATSGRLAALELSARNLRRWIKKYEDLGISGLYEGANGRGNRYRRLCSASQLLIADCVRGFMTIEQKSQSAIFADVKVAFAKENEIRRSTGRAELIAPSKETVRKAILALDPYQCDFKRYGAETARRKHAPVGTGLVLSRPLQRVELDTWKVDLISLLADSGLLHFLSEEEKIHLGLTGGSKRWHLTVAICATTRCILAMRLTRNPNALTTVQAIEMVTRDKGIWSDAVGALTSWHMCGTPASIFTDCGSEFVPYDVRVAATDLGITVEHTPGGLPNMRARVERLFRTMSIGLTQRFTGRTFSNIVERGEYDSKARAALTVDDLCTALTRWVVDIYHRTPHEGLDGETPARCWDRLTEKYGVGPAAGLKRRRLAFGTRMKRAVAKDGITVLGIRYHSEFLAEKALRRRDRTVNLRWYGEDLGAIAVEFDGEWIEIPSVFERFRGVRAQTWLTARRDLRARFKHESVLYENVVFQTIESMEAINGNAMRRIGLLADNWSEDRLEYEEEQLFIGFRCEPNPDDLPLHRAGFEYGEELATGKVGACEDLDGSEAFVSVAASEETCPVGTQRDPLRGRRSDGPTFFEIEDKR